MTARMNKLHQAVLLKEVIDAMDIKQGRYYVDATFGRGGHSQAILNKGGKVIAFDVDQAAHEFAKEIFKDFLTEKKLFLIRENFDKLEENVKKIQKENNIDKIYGCLFDFGASTDQLKDQNRGFSFDSDTTLDMRMDDRLSVKASMLLQVLSGKELTKLFWEYGGEEQARSIAKAIVEQRQRGQIISSTKQLADLVCRIKRRAGKLHPATKVFQALRIAVNDELTSIEKALPQAFDLIEKEGKLVTITFHEGEDRIVKNFFKAKEAKQQAQQLTKKPITAGEKEIEQNINSRSAKLRILERV